jgi:hypothetical protein
MTDTFLVTAGLSSSQPRPNRAQCLHGTVLARRENAEKDMNEINPDAGRFRLTFSQSG